jgi:hypothetical protein
MTPTSRAVASRRDAHQAAPGVPAEEVDLTGVIDTHVHSAPDVVPRRMDDLELGRAAARRGMRAIVLKSHHTVTADRAHLVERSVPGLRVFGAIVLNQPAGGLDPDVVETALRMGAAIVWMPTFSAEAEPVPLGPPISILEDGRLKADVCEILRLIAEHDAVLATGHISAAEVAELVPAARLAGVRQIVITHPEHPPVRMAPLAQQELRDRYDVLFERCLISTTLGGGSMQISALANRIRRIGVDSTILATDFGQPENADPPDGMASYIGGLQGLGFERREIDRMCRANPAELLGLD